MRTDSLICNPTKYMRGELRNFRREHQRRGVYVQVNFIRAGSKKIIRRPQRNTKRQDPNIK